jgi:hypothetical protein
MQNMLGAIPALGLTWTTCVSHRYFVIKTDSVLTLDDQSDNNSQTNQRVERNSMPIRTVELLFSPLYSRRICTFVIHNEGLQGLDF